MADRNPADYDATGTSKPPTWNSEQEAAQRLDEVRQYLTDLHARRQVVARTVTKSGQELDWVPIESQTADGRIAEPPDAGGSSPPYDPARPTRRVRFELQQPGAELGPPRTVPLRRYPIDRLTPDVGLRDWLSKTGHARRPEFADGPSKRSAPAGYNVHAAAGHAAPNFGTEGIINVWRPWVEWSDEFSLGQLWVVRGVDTQLQTVEVGVQVRKDSYGDWEPHVFVFYTTCGYYLQGDFKGGYNEDVKGWVQYSQVLHPGALVSPTSEFGGVQYEMELKVQFIKGNWWVKVNGEWMGYYPGSLFAATGLLNFAERAEWGGEVFDALAHPGTSATDMGSGLFPWEGFGRAAYMRNLLVQFDPGGSVTPFIGQRLVDQTDCYDIKEDFAGAGPWGVNFFWGGTGRNSACP